MRQGATFEMEHEVAIGVKYYLCLICEPKQEKVVAKTSLLLNAGMGLFAAEHIEKDEYFCEYIGEVYSTAQAIKLIDKSYLMRLGPNVYIDAKNTMDVMARYINDCRKKNRYNVKFHKVPEKQHAKVIALRDIKAGEELYVDYGKWYWLAYNLAHPDTPVH